MCPVCWATMISAFSIYLAAAAAVLIWRDWLAVLVALALLIVSGLRSLDVAAIPWSILAAFAGALAIRIGWILIFYRERIIFVSAWKRAVAFATARCPNRN
jgi:cytochrome b subunit of formate dehydrogenase